MASQITDPEIAAYDREKAWFEDQCRKISRMFDERAHADRMVRENLRQAKAKSLRLQWKMYDAWKPRAVL